MKPFEYIAAAILIITLPVQLFALAGIDGGAGVWTWWVLLSAAFFQLAAILLLKVGYEKTGKKAHLFGELR